MASEKNTRKPNEKVRSLQERTDDSIMETNDSSIVSKRSVSKLYFPYEPDFYQPFVPKYARRNPLINRGYWLRMHSIEQVVRHFLEEHSNNPKVVINLGCGYDPLPFQFWHRYPSICQNTTFVDVDYPQLMRRKIDKMLADTVLRDALLNTNMRPARLPVYLRSSKYMALGCDLRDLVTLEQSLKAELDLLSSSLLFIGEVSLTYMPVADSDALIKWACTLENARFCLLEQYLPHGLGHPFAQTMLNHFKKLSTPIHAVHKYPTLLQQQTRFLHAGWRTVDVARNLWDLWSDAMFTSPQLRRGLDLIEPFDEWEEFALFGCHYFLLVASNVESHNFHPKDSSLSANGNAESDDAVHNTRVVLASQSLAAHAALSPRRFGAAFMLQNDSVGFHGGQGPQRRLETIDVLNRSGLKAEVDETLSVPPARVCHTITNLSNTGALLVGGRASPLQALADCWRLQGGIWRRVEDLNPARFRHSSVSVNIPLHGSEVVGVLVFGGKTGNADVLSEYSLWIPNQGWQSVPVLGPRPPARFGAAMSLIGSSQDRGLILGGMDSDGTVLADMWEWQIATAPELHLRFVDRTSDVQCGHQSRAHARLGASLLPHGDSLLLIGGVSQGEVAGLSNDFMLISSGTTIHIDVPEVHVTTSVWPLLVGFCAVVVSRHEIVIAGGGAVCFSMGSFWNKGVISITKPCTAADLRPWFVSMLERIDSAREKRAGHMQVQKQKPTPSARSQTHPPVKNNAGPKLSTVQRIKLQSPEEFSRLLAVSQPTILEGLDIGPCTDLWTLDYLKKQIGPDREVVVHSCETDRMTFRDKNFQYVKKRAGDFLDGIERGDRFYLRAVSAKQPNKLPTKLEDDFPTIAADFHLPDELAEVRNHYHSSPLRISGPVSLWLHYDVLANVLCQVRGTKTLRLYPPGDVKYLDFPPGGSSSNVEVLSLTDPKLRHTHPHIATLKPGDVLFLPPMWAHAATPEEGVSVAVNVFFRNLRAGYAAGRDIYGNRDLQAYENGRRDVERVAKAFRDLPGDVAKFYLDRLAAELQEKADQIGS
ncbi:LCM-domain-containing protein [Lojkania enalia]|uniref:tRNA wybutosine-synthesizing protein 4 n=1 Tax=Lojkania enalia TaxID=147567 RepID=A0A9P4K684_9PLEO|nr:LCM-domain-containing protein [Didymosphaeria enalia]